MKILVISDYFFEFSKQKSLDKIKPIKLSQYEPLPLRGHDAIIIDMTFTNKEIGLDEIKLLYDFKIKFSEDKNILSKGNSILIVVSGSQKKDLRYEVPYDPGNPTSSFEPVDFNSYDFLKELLPDKESLKFEEGSDSYPDTAKPVSLYLERYKARPYFLFYDYNPDSVTNAGVAPLSRVRENASPCVAFENNSGRGLVVILPPYDINDRETAYLLLLKTCRSYFKQREGFKGYVKFDDAIPEPIRNDFIEAVSCFNYDLYKASLVMCRRALEGSVIALGGTGGNLKQQIDCLCDELHIINDVLRDFVQTVRVISNKLGAHSSSEDVQVTEYDMITAIEGLYAFLNNVYILPKQSKKALHRKQELEEK